MSDRAEKYAEVTRLVNEALRMARDISGDSIFKNDPINWAHLTCCYVEYYEDSVGLSGYRAHIEEAAPNCQGLTKVVTMHLKKHGHDDVEVETEW